MNKENVLKVLKENIENKNIIKYIFSDTKDYEYKKVTLSAINIKNEIKIQIESFKESKVFHNNFSLDEEKLFFLLDEYLDNFKQILAKTAGIDYIFSKKNGKFSKKEIKNNLKFNSVAHNKEKKYFLNEGEKIDFLITLGLMSKEGKIFKNSYNKFKQINKYLEFIDDTIRELKDKKLIQNSINILDFGCGKSYLTFALHYYLKKFRQELTFNIIGLDLKKM